MTEHNAGSHAWGGEKATEWLKYSITMAEKWQSSEDPKILIPFVAIVEVYRLLQSATAADAGWPTQELVHKASTLLGHVVLAASGQRPPEDFLKQLGLT
jgi:hypothetical protein